MTSGLPTTHTFVPSAAELGFRSELIFHRADGEVIDLRREHGCRLIRTPVNPTFYWGNFLLFERAPRTGDAQHWEQLFERLIERRQPLSTHRAFGWLEDAPGEVHDFLAAGYTRNDTVVMQTTRVPVVQPPTLAAQLRPLALDGGDANREWSALIDLSVATRDPKHGEGGYREFARLSVARWRALAEARQGHWFGAFVDEAADRQKLVAALGLYVEAEPQDGERLARFQSVMTDAAYRRRGLCRALIAAATRHVRDGLAADRFIIVAAAGEMPEQLYASVGFVTAGKQRGVQRMSTPSPNEGD